MILYFVVSRLLWKPVNSGYYFNKLYKRLKVLRIPWRIVLLCPREREDTVQRVAKRAISTVKFICMGPHSHKIKLFRIYIFVSSRLVAIAPNLLSTHYV